MSTLITIILPLLMIVLTGYFAGAGKWLDIASARALSKFVFLVAMPLAILHFYTTTPPPGLDLLPFLGGYFIAMVIFMALAVWSGRSWLGLDVRSSGAHAFVCTCGNAVFLGLPIALQIDGWGTPFLMLMIIEGVFVFGIATALMSWEMDPQKGGGPVRQLIHGIGKSALTPFKNPIVVASLVGVSISYLQLDFPLPVQTFLGMIGKVAGPTGLFVLGLYIATLPRDEAWAMRKNIAVVSGLKLVIFPVLAGAIVYAMTSGNMIYTGSVVLFAAMPSAVASLVQASHYGLYEKETAAAVSFASIFSLGTLVIVLMLFA